MPTETTVTPYVFLSYASAERERALAIADALEAAGIRVWIDRQAIAGGTSWGSEIVEGIQHCAVMAVACSVAAMQSRNVRQEIQLAWRYERPYLPLLLEQVAFPQQVQYFLEGWQWVELLQREPREFLPDVLRAIKRLGLEAAERAAPAAPAVSAAHPPAAVSDGRSIGGEPPHPAEQPESAPLLAAAAPFIGRETELAALRGALDGAVAGRGRLVLLAGEPGIGKTRLAERLAAEAGERGAAVLWGRCWEGEGAPAYFPWVEAVRAYLRAVDTATAAAELGPGASRIAQTVPDVHAFLPDLPPPPQLDSEQARFHLFTCMTDWLGNAARRRPQVLVLDDLHWADKPSLLLLQFLVRELATLPLLVLGTYRDTELDRRHPLAETLATLRRGSGVERLLLQGFTTAEVEGFVVATLDQELSERGRALTAALQRETEGNPFFLTETLRHLVESGALVRREGRWTSDARDIVALGIPEGVREVIGRRLARLSEAANRLLTVAAVIGREFSVEVVQQVGGANEDAVLDGLDEAEAAHLIARVPGAAGRYRFAHALIRETLYEELSPLRRVRLHQRAGEALEQLYARTVGQHLPELAHHFRQAAPGGAAEKAYQYALRAAEAARAVCAYEQAIDHWRVALDLADDDQGGVLLPDADRARLLDRLGGMMYIADTDAEAGLTSLEQALALYERLGDATAAARVHSRLGQARSSAFSYAAMDINRALEHFRTAEQILARGPESAALGYVYMGLSMAAVHADRPAEGLAAAERGVAIAERLENPMLWANTALLRANHLGVLGRNAEAWALVDAIQRRGERLNQPAIQGLAAFAAGVQADRTRDALAVETSARRALALPAIGQMGNLRRAMLANLASSLIEQGRLDEARTVKADAATVGWGENHSATLLALRAAEWEQAERQLSEGLLRFERSGDVSGTHHTARPHALLHRLKGDTPAAALRLEGGYDRALVSGDLQLEMQLGGELAVLHAEAGDVDRARPYLERCRAILSEGEDWRGLGAAIDRAEGAITAAAGRLDEAEARYTAAVATCQRYGLAWDAADTRHACGRVLLQNGAPAAALRYLDEAHAAYERINAHARWIDRVAADRVRAQT